MKSKQIEHLHPDLQPLARAFLENCTAAGLSVFITETFRSVEYQNNLYAQGRTRSQLDSVGLKHVIAQPYADRVTKAMGGFSEHNATLNGLPASRAFDFAFQVPGVKLYAESHPWSQAGAIGKALGLVWGGDFKSLVDRPHFELPKR